MDSNNNLVDSTNSTISVFIPIKYPNASTEIVCSVIEQICPNLQYLQLSDFRTSVINHIEKFRDDQLVYKMLKNSINNIDWDFVGAIICGQPKN